MRFDESVRERILEGTRSAPFDYFEDFLIFMVWEPKKTIFGCLKQQDLLDIVRGKKPSEIKRRQQIITMTHLVNESEHSIPRLKGHGPSALTTFCVGTAKCLLRIEFKR